MTKVYINYESEFSSGGEICPGQENDPWPSYETSYYDFKAVSCSLTNVNPYHEDLDVDMTYADMKQGLWVVVVRYSGGDTFSDSSGHGCIEGAFCQEEASRGACRGYSQWWRLYQGLHKVEGLFQWP